MSVNFNNLRRDKNQDTAKRQLLKALQKRDQIAIQRLIIYWTRILGTEQLTTLIVNKVLVECDGDSHRWFVQNFCGQSSYQQVQQQAENHLWQILTSAGLEPGKDFSLGSNEEVMISDRAKEVLLNRLPQEHQALFAAQLQTSTVPDIITVMEQQLGCRFFANLTAIASQKVQRLSNSQAAAYLGVLIAGLVKRNSALQDVDFPTKFIFSCLAELPQERVTAIINDEEPNPQFDELIIIQDLLAAMREGEAYNLTYENNSMILEKLRKLDLIWCGERRIAEIIATMEDWHPRNG
ncbi:hypothetical protein Nos7524_2987 [Nostoc sp. PCC 7524]|uniref:hypothetical protein n=1 Tax=Nostoc sp. (strain ATCC 29411 / PCC 7524) TaxID=28072 RepID=UPI00029ED3AF|nr:hypothetical protein [Nostoc sp. PCC 7524]AFY48796.1 hypothetical protein Nos7524_2987 [Nostoc sp. PCC 7524]